MNPNDIYEDDIYEPDTSRSEMDPITFGPEGPSLYEQAKALGPVVAREYAQGGTLSFGDEVGAGMQGRMQRAANLLPRGSLAWAGVDNRYPESPEAVERQALRENRAEIESDEKNHPGVTLASRAAGGAALTAAVAPVAAAAAPDLMAAAGGASAGQLLQQASQASKLAALGGAGLGGMLYGALDGAGAAESGHRLEGAAEGGKLGGVAGVVLHQFTPLLGQLAEQVQGLPARASQLAERLAAEATGMTPKQALALGRDEVQRLGRALLDNDVVGFGTSLERIMARAQEAKQMFGQRMGSALSDADATVEAITQGQARRGALTPSPTDQRVAAFEAGEAQREAARQARVAPRPAPLPPPGPPARTGPRPSYNELNAPQVRDYDYGPIGPPNVDYMSGAPQYTPPVPQPPSPYGPLGAPSADYMAGGPTWAPTFNPPPPPHFDAQEASDYMLSQGIAQYGTGPAAMDPAMARVRAEAERVAALGTKPVEDPSGYWGMVGKRPTEPVTFTRAGRQVGELGNQAGWTGDVGSVEAGARTARNALSQSLEEQVGRVDAGALRDFRSAKAGYGPMADAQDFATQASGAMEGGKGTEGIPQFLRRTVQARMGGLNANGAAALDWVGGGQGVADGVGGSLQLMQKLAESPANFREFAAPLLKALERGEDELAKEDFRLSETYPSYRQLKKDSGL